MKAIIRGIFALIGASAVMLFMLVATAMLFVLPPVGVLLWLVFFAAIIMDRRR